MKPSYPNPKDITPQVVKTFDKITDRYALCVKSGSCAQSMPTFIIFSSYTSKSETSNPTQFYSRSPEILMRNPLVKLLTHARKST